MSTSDGSEIVKDKLSVWFEQGVRLIITKNVLFPISDPRYPSLSKINIEVICNNPSEGQQKATKN